jgi:Transposase DDE domain group 1
MTINAAWCVTATIPADLLSWLRLLCLDDDLADAEPKTLRYRVLHTAVRLVRVQRKRKIKISETWPWAPSRSPSSRPDLTSRAPTARPTRETPDGSVEPAPPDPTVGPSTTTSTETKIRNGAEDHKDKPDRPTYAPSE